MAAQWLGCQLHTTGETVEVTDATTTMVAVDAGGKPIPFSSPASTGPPESVSSS